MTLFNKCNLNICCYKLIYLLYYKLWYLLYVIIVEADKLYANVLTISNYTATHNTYYVTLVYAAIS